MERGNLFKLGLIQIGIVAAVIIIVLFVLASLNALPFPNPFQSRQGSVPGEISPRDPIQSNVASDITATSDNGSYTLTILDKEGLIETLRQWEIYGKTFTGGYGIQGSTGPENAVSNIEVHFTTVEQPINQYVNPDGTVYLSSITNASPGKLTVNAYIGPTILNDSQKSQNLGNYFDAIFLATMYRLAYPAKSMEENKVSEQKLNEFMSEKVQSGKQFFELKKN